MSFLDLLLGRKHPPVIGLDISSSSAKLVELDQGAGGEYVLERFASEPFEKGWITDGQVEKFDEVAEAVRKVVQKSGTKTKQVVMAMPQSAVITKKIVLPAGLREEELELQVESEATQYIPFSLDEVSLDFCVNGPSESSAGDVDVLIAASRKDRVQDRQGLGEAAGLTPMVLDIESHASRLAMSRMPSRRAIGRRLPTTAVARRTPPATTRRRSTSCRCSSRSVRRARARPGPACRVASPTACWRWMRS